MVQFDNQSKQVKLKIVYYGTALGGKTSCLQHIHRVTDPERRTKLYALATASDRTLFFDLLALDLGKVRGYRVTLQLYTVPGQVQYNATRRAVLAGADAVVFVADSQRSQVGGNVESLANLDENLRSNGLDPDTIPMVLQYNKRDLAEVLPIEEMDAALNRRSFSAFGTVATTGEGVMEAFGAITEAAVVSVADRLGLSSQPEAITRLLASARSALLPYLPGEAPEAPDAPVVIRPNAKSSLLSAEELVSEAVRANVAMTDLNVRLDQLTRELEHKVAQLRTVNELSRAMSLAREPEEIGASFMDRILDELSVASGSLLVLTSDGTLQEAQRRNLASDPVLAPDGSGKTAASAILAGRKALTVRVDESGPSEVAGSRWLDEMLGLGFSSAMAVPLVAQDRALGLVTCYADATRSEFDEEDIEIAVTLAGNAAVALANARAWLALEQLNRSLEDTVRERTAELEAANRQLREFDSLKGDLLNRIAHELNTPVTAIQTAARILSRYEEMPPEKATKFVSIISQETGRLAELIAGALQAVLLGLPESRPEPAEIAIADLLKRAVSPLKGEVERRELELKVKVAAGLETIRGDEEQLEAAIRAVVKNAVEFSQEKGSVTITVRPSKHDGAPAVEFRVDDSGVGIPPDDLPHVAELFWQGGNVLTEKPRGVGLGLAVAQRVADHHGGSLAVTSEEGKGTSVVMVVPGGAQAGAA